MFSRWCRGDSAHFDAVGAAFYTTARLNGAHFSAVGAGVMLPILLLLVPPFTTVRVNIVPMFSRWCRGYSAHFDAVGAAFHTTARVNAAHFSAVGAGVMLPILLLFVPPFTPRRGQTLPAFWPLV